MQLTTIQVERTLRDRLEGASLVCSVDHPPDLVEAARDSFWEWMRKRGTPAGLGRVRPATVAVFLAMEGAAKYDGGALWPNLGIEQAQSSAIGEEFLRALGALHLPDFQVFVRQQRGLRFVTPILIHGGLAAERARQVVGWLDDQLRIGLTDGSEARRRLMRFDDPPFGRPFDRLVQAAPDYCSALLDRLVGYLTDEHHDLDSLPHQLAEALRRTEGDRALATRRRLLPPTLEFDPWSGLGPHLVAATTGGTWSISDGGRPFDLRPGDQLGVRPDSRVEVTQGACSRTVATGRCLWFDERGQQVEGGHLPSRAIVLRHRRDVVRATGPVTVEDEGLDLGGPWSSYVAEVLDLPVGPVDVISSDGSTSVWRGSVEAAQGAVALLGAPHPSFTGPHDSPVFSQAITIDTCGLTLAHWRFRSFDRSTPVRSGTTVAELQEALDEGAVAGELKVEHVGSPVTAFPLTIVPGLDVAFEPDVVGPSDVATAVVSGKGIPGNLLLQEVGSHVSRVAIPLAGAAGGLTLHVPRVGWALLRSTRSKADFDQGLIEVDDLKPDEDGLVLVVRSPLDAHVAVTLWSADERRQVVPGKLLRSVVAGAFQAAIPLTVFADTLRSLDGTGFEIRVTVGAREWVAVRRVDRSRPGPPPEVGIQRELEHLPSSSAERLARLTYLLGRVAAVTPPAQRLGAWFKGADWAAVIDALDRYSGAEALRYRHFAGQDTFASAMAWARLWAGRLAGLDRYRSNDFTLWQAKCDRDERRPDDWAESLFVTTVIGRNRGQSRVPGVLLGEVLACVGGDHDAEQAIAEAADLVEPLAIEAVALALEITRRGHTPQQRAAVEPPVTQRASARATTFEGWNVAVDGDAVILTPPSPQALEVVAVATEGHLVAALSVEADAGRYRVRPPHSLVGDHRLAPVDPRCVPLGPTAGTVGVTFRGTKCVARPKTPPIVRGRGLDIADALAAHERSSMSAWVKAVLQRLDDGDLAEDLVDELFEDEAAAARRLEAMSEMVAPAERERIALSVMSAATLFDGLGSHLRMPDAVLSRCPLLWAVMNLRSTRDALRVAGIKVNVGGKRGEAAQDLSVAAAVRLQNDAAAKAEPWTFRFDLTGLDARVRTTIQRLAPRVSHEFLDLVVATHVAVAIDRATPAAIRLLLDVHRKERRLASNAVIAGLILTMSHRS
jgi:hypothetical protein